MSDPALPLVTEAAPAARLRSLWTNSDFVKLWSGQTISELGSRITREGIPLAAVLVLHAGTVQMGFLSALGGAAVLVFGLVAGVWVDRLRRRPILIAADLGRAAILVSVPAAAVAGVLSMGQLYAVAALAGILTVFFDVAYQSYLPALVAREQILEGNSKLALSSSIAEIAGPGVTGVLVQLITAPVAILFDAVSFLFSALMVVLIRKPEPPAVRREPEHLVAETLAGVRFIFREPLLRALGLRSATTFFFMGFLGPLYVLYAIQILHLRPALLGVVIAMGGVGAMVGSVVAPRIVQRFGLGRTFVVASLVQGITNLLIPLAGLIGTPGTLAFFAVACLMVPQLFGDMAFMVYNINEVTLRQTVAPEHVLGRVNAGMQLLARGIWPIGSLIGGILAAAIGVRTTLALAAAGVVLSTLWLLASPLRRVR
ncbi:MAG TPA: MFS transporter [Thermoanaerobaculia bacterium]|jgi:MFS family permease|nr:MFS transporter [Thermoanaerobaculia bacterium]